MCREFVEAREAGFMENPLLKTGKGKGGYDARENAMPFLIPLVQIRKNSSCPQVWRFCYYSRLRQKLRNYAGTCVIEMHALWGGGRGRRAEGAWGERSIEKERRKGTFC